MRVTVVGSGDAANALGRGHSCYWLEEIGRRAVMVDFGATALGGLQRLGRSPLELAGLVFTHLHGDHIGGFPFLYIDAMFTCLRTEPLRVLGPVGVEARLRELLRVTYGSLAERETPFPWEVTELRPGGEVQFCGLTVRGFAAEHQDPPEQPLCLQIEEPGGATVAFSGDTAPCDGVLQAAADVDLFVAECTGMKPPFGRHHTWEDWQRLLPGLTAKRVLFSHLGRGVRARIPELLAEANDPRVQFADDGLQLIV